MISHHSYRANLEAAEKQATAFAGAIVRNVKEIDRLMSMLKEANDLLRSAHAIASRKGERTNWPAFTDQLSAILAKQNPTLVSYFDGEDGNRGGDHE